MLFGDWSFAAVGTLVCINIALLATLIPMGII
jgi:hypothetical protein